MPVAIEIPNGRTDMPHKVIRKELTLDGGLAQLDVAKLMIRLTDTPKPLPDFKTLNFGSTFTDHMAITSFDSVSGWSAPEIKPYAPLALDPASSCLQYCDSIFEGMKAYLGHDGKVRLFRPELNMRRLERSMARVALPPIDGDAVLELIKQFVRTEKRFIPTASGNSLYLRPTAIGTRPALGLCPANNALLYILGAPSGPYFARPLALLASTNAVRAWPGGTGGDKYGGNYAPGFAPQREAAARGYDQVLWLFGEEQRVTEGGAMNVFIVRRRPDADGLDVITPPLDGTILPGVTRASCLALVADPAFHAAVRGEPSLYAAERTFTMHELVQWTEDGTLLEMFCVGTAAIVAGVQRIGFEGRDVCVPTFAANAHGLGPVGGALREKILAIQEGREEYQGWGVVCE